MTTQFLQDRITATQNQIVALETAAANLMSGAIQSYTLDTGQSRQTVTKADLSAINAVLDSLYNRVATLEARLYGNGVITARPQW